MSALRGSQGDVPVLSPVESIEVRKQRLQTFMGQHMHLPIRLEVPLSGNKNEKCKEV